MKFRQGASGSTEIDEVDMVDADVFQSLDAIPMEDTLTELAMDVITTFAPRKGKCTYIVLSLSV